jgi:tetratricopeptide (TPR) repeat protein
VAKGEEACEAVVRIERETQLGCIFEDAASVGVFHTRRGQWKRARSHLETTLAKNRGRNVAAYGACLVALGELEGKEGDLKSAHAMLNEALEISRSGGNVLLEIWGLTGLAEAALGMERLDIVDACVGRALALQDADRAGNGLPGALGIVRGQLASARRDWAEARGHFEQATAVTRAFELRYDEARAQQGLGMMRLRDGSADGHAQAVDALRRARGLFQQVGADRDLEAVGGALARLG